MRALMTHGRHFKTDRYVAGEYPSSLADAMPELHVSGNASNRLAQINDTEYGKRTGLYHLVLGQGQNAFVGNGSLDMPLMKRRC